MLPMKVATAAEMRTLEAAATTQVGIPGIVLMENAGARVAAEIKRMLGSLSRRRILVLAGPGNNGGDGCVIARHLYSAGAMVAVWLFGRPERLPVEAKVNWEIWQRIGPEAVVVPPEASNDLAAALAGADLVVDALLGTGWTGTVRSGIARAIEQVNASSRRVIAVDLPSGIEADTGQVGGVAVRAERTVTFGLPKPGLLFYPGAEYAGEVLVADICLPAKLMAVQGIQLNLTTPSELAAALPRRAADTHKGDYGKALVVAGSRGMAGAALLTAQGALRVGSGLVTLALPAGLQAAAVPVVTEALTRGLPETAAGSLSLAALPEIEELLTRVDALAIGPGLSTQAETVELVRQLLPRLRVPAVIDADGLNALAGESERLRQVQVPVVVTPHAGEMARLMGTETEAVQRDRLGVARRAAQAWQAVVVLKGARTIIAAPSGEAYINPTGNPGMAAGGAGDVLTGVIVGLLARGIRRFWPR